MFDLSVESEAFLIYCANRKVLSSKTIKAYRTDLSQFEVYSHGLYEKKTICNYLVYIYLSYSELSEIEIYEMLSFIGFFYSNSFSAKRLA